LISASLLSRATFPNAPSEIQAFCASPHPAIEIVDDAGLDADRSPPQKMRGAGILVGGSRSFHSSVNLDPGVDASTVVHETQSTGYWLPTAPPDCTASLRVRKTVCVVASDTYKDNDYHSNRHDDGVAVIVSVCGDVPIFWEKR
jgi:hypothetical protein